MSADWVDVRATREKLVQFFARNRSELYQFGSTVNQVFEAHCFAAVAARYKQEGWHTAFLHPRNGSGSATLKLKFSTRGRPSNYSYVACNKNGEEIQIRHQLRVATHAHRDGRDPGANVCLDVAVIRSADLSAYSTYDALPNRLLITMGEAKHMSAFAELVAGFLGLVHELQPFRLGRQRPFPNHPAAFLYVSGLLYPSAAGMYWTIKKRRYDVKIFSQAEPLTGAMPLSTHPVPARKRPTRRIGSAPTR